MVDRFADSKLVTIQCEGWRTVPTDNLANMAKSSSTTRAASSSRIKRDRVIPPAKRCWTNCPCSDIDIQEVPIEEVIRRIFDRRDQLPVTARP